MVGVEQKLYATDNAGVVKGKCIHVYGGARKNATATLGDTILISSRKLDPTKRLKKKLYKVLLVTTKRNFRRPNGHFVSFDRHAFITINTSNLYKGVKVYGPVCREMRFHFFQEIGRLTIKQI